MKQLHAHVQIEYTDFVKTKEEQAHYGKIGDSFQRESMIGFDPETGRNMAHRMLDEYLDYLVRLRARVPNVSGIKTDKVDNRFIVFHYLDKH